MHPRILWCVRFLLTQFNSVIDLTPCLNLVKTGKAWVHSTFGEDDPYLCILPLFRWSFCGKLPTPLLVEARRLTAISMCTPCILAVYTCCVYFPCILAVYNIHITFTCVHTVYIFLVTPLLLQTFSSEISVCWEHHLPLYYAPFGEHCHLPQEWWYIGSRCCF